LACPRRSAEMRGHAVGREAAAALDAVLSRKDYH
jgi:hypothetical protein